MFAGNGCGIGFRVWFDIMTLARGSSTEAHGLGVGLLL